MVVGQLSSRSGSDFEVWTPFDLVKAGPDSPDGLIKGVATSEREDEDGDFVDQDGLEWGYFKSHGFITYEHPLGVMNIVGHPTDVSPTTVEKDGKVFKATDIEGLLLLDDELGKKIYEKSLSLKKAGGHRRLGFSIEGKVLPGGRQGKRITKARVVSVAVSAAPKNRDSWFEPLAASMFGGGYQVPYPLPWLFRAEGVGYPQQGEAAVGTGGLEKLVPQSLQGGGPTTVGMTRDLMVVKVLKKFPFLSWSQGMGLVEEIVSKMKGVKV